jgi:ABC-2 type transport system ATP-binding protein
VQNGTLAELRGQTRTSIHVTLAKVPTVAQLTGFHNAHLDGNRLTASVDSADVGNAMTTLAPFGITALTVEPPSLESLFLRLYEEPSDRAAR